MRALVIWLLVCACVGLGSMLGCGGGGGEVAVTTSVQVALPGASGATALAAPADVATYRVTVTDGTTTDTKDGAPGSTLSFSGLKVGATANVTVAALNGAGTQVGQGTTSVILKSGSNTATVTLTQGSGADLVVDIDWEGGSNPVTLAAPTGLTATPGDGTATLGWSAPSSTSGITKYNVYRSGTSGSGYSLIGSVNVGVTTYADSGLTNGQTYYYVVRSGDASGNESANSNQATAKPEGGGGDHIVNPKDSTMKLILIPAGEAIFGGDDGYDDEIPQFTASVPAYYLGETEVTNAQYATFLNDQRPSDTDLNMWIDLQTDAWKEIEKAGDAYTAVAGREDHPVVYVSWHGAKAYCDWAGLRLPSELEWEKGARGADGREYPWGGFGHYNGWDKTKCRNSENQPGFPPAGTCEVFDYAAGKSPYGLYNMAGNASEWTADWYSSSVYNQYSIGDLTPPSSGQLRVTRGGSWMWYNERFYRCAGRLGDPPNGGFNSLGFRCARSR